MRILCTRPNASMHIGGVSFVKHGTAMLSEEISEKVAAHFLKIEGYTIAEPAENSETGSGADQAVEREALLLEAKNLGIKAKNNWTNEHLIQEIAARAKTNGSNENGDAGKVDDTTSA